MLYRSSLSPLMSMVLIALLAVLFWAMRATGFFGPASLGWLLPLGFCIMAILPWVLLTAHGRRQIGLQKPINPMFYLIAILCGIGAAVVCFLLGYLLFGHTIDNWFVSVGNNYKSRMDTSGMSFWILTLIFTLPAVLFSPIGEEIFFRGMLQKTLEQKWKVVTSTIIECGLFSVIHLIHHGILKTAAGFSLLPVSGVLWVMQMFFVALMFAWLRMKSGSIFIAIVAHMVFNITMNSTIFLFLW